MTHAPPTPTLGNRSVKLDRLRKTNVVATVTMFLYAFWLTSDHTWNPDGAKASGLDSGFFYWDQAKSLMRAQLHVVPPSHKYWWLECFTIEHKCYGYFGITPSLMRVPAVVLFGDTFVGLAPLFVAVAVAVAFWAAMDLVRQVLAQYVEAHPEVSDRFAVRWMVVVGALLGPASILVLVARGRVYEEAVAWSAAFLCLTFNLVYRWSRNRTDLFLYGAILTASLATLSRPSAIPAAVVLGVAVVVVGWRWGGITTRVLGASLAAVPAVAFAFVFWRKFGSLSFPWQLYGPYISVPSFTRVIDNNHGSTVGLRFALTNLANYFRPDSIRLELGPPWATLRSVDSADLIILPTTRAGQVWGNRIPSLTNVMPVPLVLTVIACVQHAGRVVKRATRDAALMPTAMLVAGIAGGVPAILYYALAGRYLGDLYPLMVVGTAFSLPWLLDRARRPGPRGRWIFPVISVLAFAGCVVLFQIRDSVF